MDTDLLKKLNPFFAQYKPLNYKKGQVILRPEDKIEYIYFIEKGFVKFYYISPEGKELTFLIYKPGYIFPLLFTFLGNTTTRYYFEAYTPLTLRRAPRETFTELISTNNFLIFSLGQEVVLRWQELLNRMELLKLGSACQNVAYIIDLCAKQFGVKSGRAITIDLPLAHKDIASMVGLTRETVSLEMKKLEQLGLIEYKRGNITVKDIDMFRKKTQISENYDFT
ncbi:MAG TPA: Crp/Fnr family transcriptional regulator [Patescibacteria group bacterium]|jgi:CRP/FNR family transcriptional regulator|nr:Crp/Fnr family transcriptional regulator [Patescibacteria group bacterium]